MNSATSNGRRVGIIQSNYIPWKGYFDFIACCDDFVILDQVQYTRRDWRNRNLIKTSSGLAWLTVPVTVKGKYDQAINETMISNSGWADEHTRTLWHTYKRADGFDTVWPLVEDLFGKVRQHELLTHVNEVLLRGIASYLGIDTPIHRSEQFGSAEGKNERLINICRQLGATEYLSGPAAKSYIDESLWNAAGIQVRYKSYAGYPEYQQLHPPFEHGVSIVDLLFCTGKDACKYIGSAAALEPALA
ncbi:MAG TPA: WbqC family protein [Candidatus Baltobacteraceae bacterium]|nr:WbqC family protein [Candidatus Baltobacteraceae bacterium]